ncbi:MAG: diacylglycerol kinase, partial [Streptococcus gallolyticus]|nr:diacylglycerol kinase [Streptococcus gallolyticus]
DEISDDALVWNQEDLALEAIAQKFTQEVDELNSEE